MSDLYHDLVKIMQSKIKLRCEIDFFQLLLFENYHCMAVLATMWK